MNIGNVNLETRPLVIAEIGANHEGDLDAAKTMIREAARAGADAVKFQTYTADKIVARTEAARFAHFQKLALPESAYAELADEARSADVMFLSTPFDLEAVELLDPLVPAFKIASGDLTFVQLLERVAGTGKPMLLSTGMASIDEIDDALTVIQRAAELTRSELAQRVVLLHCVSSYPTAPTDANLLVIPSLRNRFGVPVGYSDHTLGIFGCTAAVALGACVVEKHFTLQKEGRTLRDHQLSADPDDLEALVASVTAVSTMMGTGDKSLPACERESLNSARRSVAARVDIEAGRMIPVEQLTCLRPGGGLPPASLPAVVGKTCAVEIPEGHQIPVSVLSSS
jgi:N-acetylneuraminate synthase/N,N'-diacetyllegionaminate synthase